MRARLTRIILAIIVVWPTLCLAQQDAELEITQDALNRLVNKLGVLSYAGVSQPMIPLHIRDRFQFCHHVGYMDCPLPGGDLGFGKYGIPIVICESHGGGASLLPAGDPVSFQWWVTNAYFTVEDGYMTFTATVRWRVGDTERTETRKVGASIYFETLTNQIVVIVDRFQVSLMIEVSGYDELALVALVDIDKLYNLSVRVDPQEITVPLLDGTDKTVTGKVLSLSPDYVPGRVILKNIDIGF